MNNSLELSEAMHSSRWCPPRGWPPRSPWACCSPPSWAPLSPPASASPPAPPCPACPAACSCAGTAGTGSRGLQHCDHVWRVQATCPHLGRRGTRSRSRWGRRTWCSWCRGCRSAPGTGTWHSGTLRNLAGTGRVVPALLSSSANLSRSHKHNSESGCLSHNYLSCHH